MSPSVLNDRLAELREADIVELDPGSGFRLTGEGGAWPTSHRPPPPG
jgi:hypothetical protein